jgi:hypothetical protein
MDQARTVFIQIAMWYHFVAIDAFLFHAKNGLILGRIIAPIGGCRTFGRGRDKERAYVQ